MKRHRLRTLVVLLAAVLAAAGFWYVENYVIEAETFSLASPRLPPAFDGLRVVSLADLHGRVFPDGRLAEAVAAAREFREQREARSRRAADPIAEAALDPRARATFEGLAEGLALGGRAIARVARVARTIADLEGRDRVSEEDVVEALGFRSRSMG